MRNESRPIRPWSLVFRILTPLAYACLVSYFSHQSLTNNDTVIEIGWMAFYGSDKILHALEFFGFTIVLVLSLQTLSSAILRYSLVFLLAGSLAFGDEVHQIFVDGRMFSVFDIGADLVGICVGILCMTYRRRVVAVGIAMAILPAYMLGSMAFSEESQTPVPIGTAVRPIPTATAVPQLPTAVAWAAGGGLTLRASAGGATWGSVISRATVHLRGVTYADSTTAVPIVSEGRLDYLSNSLYYLPSVTEKEAQRLLDYLVQGKFFLGAADIDLRLRKEAGSYELRMTLKEGIDPRDADISNLFKIIACNLEASVFPDSSVHWIIVEPAFSLPTAFEAITARYICLSPITSSSVDTGERLDYLSNSLYYLPSVTEKEAQRLLDYLVQGKFFLGAADIDLRLRKEAGSYELRMTLKEGIDPRDADISNLFKIIACNLEASVFPDSSVHWIIVDDYSDVILARYMCF